MVDNPDRLDGKHLSSLYLANLIVDNSLSLVWAIWYWRIVYHLPGWFDGRKFLHGRLDYIIDNRQLSAICQAVVAPEKKWGTWSRTQNAFLREQKSKLLPKMANSCQTVWSCSSQSDIFVSFTRILTRYHLFWRFFYSSISWPRCIMYQTHATIFYNCYIIAPFGDAGVVALLLHSMTTPIKCTKNNCVG